MSCIYEDFTEYKDYLQNFDPYWVSFDMSRVRLGNFLSSLFSGIRKIKMISRDKQSTADLCEQRKYIFGHIK